MKMSKKIFGAIAALALFVPLTVAAALNPVLDSDGLYKIANTANSGAWGTTAEADPGETLTFMVHVHNKVFDTTLQNVKVKATLPAGEVKSYASTATVSADNASPVSGTTSFTLSESAKVEYISGSTRLYNHSNVLEKVLPDGITSGTGVAIGDIKGCWDYEKWIIFKAKVVQEVDEEYAITVRKYEDLDGDAARDSNEAWLSGWSIRLTGNGVNLEYLTNSDGRVTFHNLPAGTYTVAEVQKSGWTNTTALSKTVTVNSEKGNGYVEFGNKKVVVPVSEPTPEPLPVTGPAEAMAGILATMGIGGGSYAYRKSRKRLTDSFKKF
jgi:uncharacterized repeat protein (TIGR01451 family)